MTGLIKRIRQLLAYRLYFRQTIWLFEHRRPVQINCPAQVLPATRDNLADLASFQNKEYLKQFREFLEAGDRGYLAYVNEQCVHRSWVQIGPKQVTLDHMLSIPLPADDVFIHYCETASMARGQGIFPFVLAHIVVQHSDAARILIAVRTNNQPSIQSITKAGFEAVEEYRILVLLGVRQVRRRTVPKE